MCIIPAARWIRLKRTVAVFNASVQIQLRALQPPRDIPAVGCQRPPTDLHGVGVTGGDKVICLSRCGSERKEDGGLDGEPHRGCQ